MKVTKDTKSLWTEMTEDQSQAVNGGGYSYCYYPKKHYYYYKKDYCYYPKKYYC